MRILHIVDKIGSDGISRNIKETSYLLEKKEVEVFIITGRIEQSVSLDQESVNVCKYINDNGFFSHLKIAKRIISFCTENNIDVVHFHSTSLFGVLKYIKKCINIGIVFTIYYDETNNRNFAKKINTIVRFSDYVTTVSDYVKNNIVNKYKINPNLIDYRPRGVNVEYFCRKKISHYRLSKTVDEFGISENSATIVVSLDFNTKLYKSMLLTLKCLQNINFTAYLIDSNMESGGKSISRSKKIMKQIEKLNLDKSVFCVRNISDLPALYALTDIFIYIGSRHSRFNRSIYEAGVVGNVIMASNNANISDIIDNGVNGFLFNSDEVVGTSRKILNLINTNKISDGEYKRYISEYFTKNFDLNNSVEEDIIIYNKLRS